MRKATMLGLGVYGTEETIDLIEIEDFSSQISILDYTSVMISVEGIVYDYLQQPGKYDGLQSLNDDDKSAMLVRDMERRKNEVIELLKQGNNVFVILPSEQNIYIRTGEKKYSGTGRNRATTNIVEIFDVLSFLPVRIKLIKASGRNINYVGDSRFEVIKENLMKDFQYRSYISEGEGISLLQIANTTKSVGMVIEYEKGKIILLPEFAEEELYIEGEEWEEALHRCISTFVRLDAELKQSVGEFELPEWTESFMLPKEREERGKLSKYIEKWNCVKEKIEKQEEVIGKLQKPKLALVSKGKVLEEICKEMFLELGFEEIQKGHNRSDLVLKYKGRDVVVEIKGLSKSAGEKNAAQLEKWVSEHIEQYGRQPKAILLVNAFRNTKLDERSNKVFPNQMLKYSSSRGQCLISTTQFVCLYLDCISNARRKDRIVKSMLDTVGVYEEYSDTSLFIEEVKEESE